MKGIDSATPSPGGPPAESGGCDNATPGIEENPIVAERIFCSSEDFLESADDPVEVVTLGESVTIKHRVSGGGNSAWIAANAN